MADCDLNKLDIRFPITDEEREVLGSKGERLNISVANVLGRRIVTGGLPQDYLLPKEKELWELFGVSRTVLREAVKALVEKGIIRTKQKAGTLVNPRCEWNLFDKDILAWMFEKEVDKKLLHDIVELRSSIEPAVVKLAAIRATDEDIKAIGEAFHKMASSETPEEHSEADVCFHMAIFDACKNEMLLQFKTVIKTILESSFRIQHKSSFNSEAGVDLHKKILDRIKDRDADGAEVFMKYIIIKAKDELEENLCED
ncbi:FadR family transcriptional regulator [Photobacterium sagamiensis]|uniref:FadR/GntR family transcriptional regulator n=1 Tax=Photobacterium sagamiensis TaxID=2910241 RepID=UPI003D0B7CFE